MHFRSLVCIILCVFLLIGFLVGGLIEPILCVCARVRAIAKSLLCALLGLKRALGLVQGCNKKAHLEFPCASWLFMGGLNTQIPLEWENFLGCETPQNCSWGWRKILKVRESVRSLLNGKLDMGAGLIYGMIIGIHKGSQI